MAVVDSLKIDVVLNGKKAEAWMKRFQKNMVGINKIAKANNTIFKDFLRLAGVAGFTKLSMEAMNLGHSLEMLSKRSGVSASNLSGMRNALSAAGGKAEMFDALVKNMSHDLAKWQFGDSKFFQELNKWGVNALGNNGELRDTVSIMFDLADAAQNMANNFGDLAAIAKLEDLGIPAEFAQEMVKGRSHFYNFYKENVKRTGALTDEESKKLNEVKKRFSELGTAISTAFEKGVASLSYFDEAFKGLSKFISDHPLAVSFTTLAASIPLATTAIKVLTGAVSTLGSVATASLAPFAKIALIGAGLIGTPLEIMGYNISGEKIKKTKPDMVDDLISFFTKPAEKKDLTPNIPSSERFSVNNEVPERIFVEDDNGNLTELSSWDDLASYNGASTTTTHDSHDFNLEQTNNITVETMGTNGEEIGNDIVERLGQITIPTKPFFNSTGVR